MTRVWSALNCGWERLIACSLLTILLCPALLAQAPPAEQTFHVSRADAEAALRKLQAYSGARLPTLDGFVSPEESSLDSYQRGYYQYSIQVDSLNATESRVRVSAKITAWHEDPNASKSGYRVLPSNGRLESDLLERLETALGTHPASVSVPAQPAPQSSSKPDKAAAATTPSLTSSVRPPADRSNPFATPAVISPVVPSRSEAMAGNSPKDLMDRHIQQLTQE